MLGAGGSMGFGGEVSLRLFLGLGQWRQRSAFGGNDALVPLVAAIAKRVHCTRRNGLRNGNMIPPNIPLHRRAECAGLASGRERKTLGERQLAPFFLSPEQR